MPNYQIGAATMSPVIEMVGPVRDPADMFPDFEPEAWRRELGWMQPDFVDPISGHYVSSIQSWLLQIGGATVLVDTCAGNDKERLHSPRYHRLQTSYLAALRAEGVREEDVDAVVLTHLHEDHVGWNTRLIDGRWIPTFPRARYVVAACELADFVARATAPGAVGDLAAIHADSVRPLLDRGLLTAVSATSRILPGVTLAPAPGHTRGQVAVRVESAGARALITADIFHHPIQIVQPDWNTKFCDLPAVARATRRAVLEAAADSDLLLCPAHFGQRGMARIVRTERGFRPEFVDAATAVT